MVSDQPVAASGPTEDERISTARSTSAGEIRHPHVAGRLPVEVQVANGRFRSGGPAGVTLL